MKYKHIFFDLDHTLWNFESNVFACLLEIYKTFDLENQGVGELNTFLSTYSIVNKQYWARLERGEISIEDLRINRFKTTLSQLDIHIDEVMSSAMSDSLLRLLPTKTQLIAGARDILDYLNPNYRLHIISNGWHKVQIEKLTQSGIYHYFDEIITNEVANARKPDRGIFEYAFSSTGAKSSESIMIGDSFEADIIGAMNVGMDTIYFNPEGLSCSPSPTYDIAKLSEIRAIL